MKKSWTVFLLICLILTGCTNNHSDNVENNMEELPDGYHYVVKDGEIAEFLDYNYKQDNMYLSGLKTFDEFITPEFGAANEGSVSLDADKGILTFNMTKATGTLSGGIDGPKVYFEMNVLSKQIIDKTFTPAPDYIALGKREFSKHNKEVVKLSDKRMIEIGTFFYEFIEKISQ